MKKLGALLVLVLSMLLLFKTAVWLNLNDIESVKHFILSFGPLAPIVYIIMFTLVPLTLFPDAILAIASGTIFGLFWGTVYTMIGAACGATLSFYIARFLGRDFVMHLIKHKAEWFEAGVERRGFLIVLIMRLVPLIPFDVISYGAGLSKIKFTDFLMGTLLGIIPGVLVYVNLGDKALDVTSPAFYVSIGLLIGLFVLSYYLKKHLSFSKIQHHLLQDDKE